MSITTERERQRVSHLVFGHPRPPAALPRKPAGMGKLEWKIEKQRLRDAGRGPNVHLACGATFAMRDSLRIIQDLKVPAKEAWLSGGGARSLFWRHGHSQLIQPMKKLTLIWTKIQMLPL